MNNQIRCVLAAAAIIIASPSMLRSADLGSEATIMEVVAGEVFDLTLQSNPTTGFRWDLAGPVDEAVVSLVEHRYMPPAKQIPGRGGSEVWSFRAVGPGETDIVLVYARSWEKGKPPARRMVYHIVVE